MTIHSLSADAGMAAQAAAPVRTPAKAAFAGKEEMVRRSTAIAVVEITKVEEVEGKGSHWTYRQRATAVVKTLLKGSLPKDAPFAIFGDETFICARCHFEPGRYLLFLTEDKAPDGSGMLVGSNWHLSVRPITADPEKPGQGDRVEWYANDQDYTLAPAPLADVLAEVRKLVAGERATK